ncbi:MAG: phosphate ABC transporter substrate-binding protein PstS [Solirubrobacteraceae bacterium]
MPISRMAAIAATLAAALGVAACGSSSSSSSSSSSGSSSSAAAPSSSSSATVSATVDGAGSTLAAPIYQQWAGTLKSKGLTVNYNAVGSGAGQTDLESATVAFAGSDPALKPADVKAMKGPVLQFPVAAGAITVSYNLPGVKAGLKLTGPVIADIFSGKVAKWNDSEITGLNPGVSLPSTSITVIHRSDSSGTTEGFTTYLSDVSPSWKSAIGEGKDVKWPVGTGAAKNSGVAAAVKQTTGAVGYVEQAYALENGFTYASVKNSTGTYVAPTIANTSDAFLGVAVPADLGISTINSPNAGAYPIVSQTFLDAYTDPCKDGGLSSTTAKGLYEWLSYAFGAGQGTLGSGGNQLPYAPVPASLAAKDQAQLKTMTCNGAPLS